MAGRIDFYSGQKDDLKIAYISKDKDIEAINLLFSQYDAVDEVLIYSSRAKGNYKTGSDIDLTIVGEGLSFSEQMRLESELDDLLLPYKEKYTFLCRGNCFIIE